MMTRWFAKGRCGFFMTAIRGQGNAWVTNGLAVKDEAAMSSREVTQLRIILLWCRWSVFDLTSSFLPLPPPSLPFPSPFPAPSPFLLPSNRPLPLFPSVLPLSLPPTISPLFPVYPHPLVSPPPFVNPLPLVCLPIPLVYPLPPPFSHLPIHERIPDERSRKGYDVTPQQWNIALFYLWLYITQNKKFSCLNLSKYFLGYFVLYWGLSSEMCP